MAISIYNFDFDTMTQSNAHTQKIERRIEEAPILSEREWVHSGVQRCRRVQSGSCGLTRARLVVAGMLIEYVCSWGIAFM